MHDWSRYFDGITDDQLRRAKTWSQIADDQNLLHRALQNIREAERSVLVQRRLLNYQDGLFIKQILRDTDSFESRVTRLKEEVEKSLKNNVSTHPGTPKFREDQTPEAFVRALYRVLLLREPDPGGLASGVALMQAGRNFEHAMRSCMKSSEFATKHRQFVDTYMRSKMPANNLTTLANKYGSDKGTQRGAPPHKYTYLYDLILDRYRNFDVNVLELGLAVGGPEVGGPVDRRVDLPSVQMWLEYFPSAHVYGFDISDFSHMKQSRFTFVRGDSGSEEDIERLANTTSGFDVVIDDGSHASYHQQLAFKHLFPKLRPGGTYIIEDLQWQPSAYEDKPIPLPKTRDFMIGFFEGGEYLPNELLSEDFMRAARDFVASYAWFPAFNGAASLPKVFVLRKAGAI